MDRRVFSQEEILALLASDTESGSGDDSPFFLSSPSSSESDSEPPRRRLRTDPASPQSSTAPQSASTSTAPQSASTSTAPQSASAMSDAPQSSDPTWTTPENYLAQIPEFTGNSGIHFDTAGLKEVDFYRFFLSEDLIQIMVEQTNLYAQQFMTLHPSSFYTQPHRWTPVTPAEMLKFWGIILCMGLVKKPRIRDYWSTDILYHTPMFRHAISRMRFEAILKFLHFVDNTQCPPRGDPSFDRLCKIRPLINHCNAKFAQAYTPEKCISIDESLVHFKGRLQFRQYLPSKRARYGIKMYKLCESTSGYTHKFRVYEGKDSHIEPPECPPFLGVSGKIVWDLVHPLLGQGYHLYLDNFYTSVPLFKSLASRSTVACGTVRKNQRSLPRSLVGQPLRKGDSRALCSDNVLLVKYKDKRDVLVLTTIHGHTITHVPVRGTSTEIPKPDCILDYNRYMGGGVDLSDQVLKPYSAMRKSRVWYKKLAVHIMQMALYNAYVLHRCAGQRGTFLDFQEAVIKSLIFGDQVEAGASTSGSEVTRIVPGQHFPGQVPQTAKKGRTQKRCRVCSKRGIRKDTIYHCESCPGKPGLCMNECFRIYHTTLE